MLFTSLTFLLFLAALIIVYSLCPQRYRWLVLLIGSFTFYGFAGPIFLLYIVSTILITYICTMRIRKLRIERDAKISETQDKQARRAIRDSAKASAKRLMILCLFLIIGILAVVKYTDFAISNVNTVMGFLGSVRRFGLLGIALPLGISFYTFQTAGYVADVYREKARVEDNPLKLALFVSFFPQVVQGPISRFSELSKTLYSGAPITGDNLSRGATRILWCFFKKLVVADRLWPALTFLTENSGEFQGVYYLFTIALYAVILYCDFSGGIDIAIGTAEIFGIRLPENFNRPFYSRSIQEYWQRWHMTMYSWFRDYVFYPIAASKRMLKLSKSIRNKKSPFREHLAKHLPVHISLVFVWFLTGLWHGATWNFIVWGLSNGIVLIISLELAPLYERFNARFPALSQNRIWRLLQIFRTFWLMNIIRSFDIYAGVGNTFKMMGSVFTNFSLGQFLSNGIVNLNQRDAMSQRVASTVFPLTDCLSACAGLLVVFWVSYLGRGETDFRDRLGSFKWPLRYAITGLILFMTIILGAYGYGFDARQFIYNMF